MKFVLSLLMGLMAIVLNTALLFHHSFVLPLFDLLLPLIAYISIFGPMVQSIVLIIILGGLMDGVSGSPLGLYIVSYFWVFLSVRGSMYFLDAGSLFLFPLILAFGILLQNILFALCAHGFSFESFQVLFIFRSLLLEVIIGLIVAPFFLLFFNWIYLRYGRWAAHFKVDSQDASNK